MLQVTDCRHMNRNLRHYLHLTDQDQAVDCGDPDRGCNVHSAPDINCTFAEFPAFVSAGPRLGLQPGLSAWPEKIS